MATLTRKNFGNIALADVPKVEEYHRCNFARRNPDTSGPEPVGHEMFGGDQTARVFIECNMVNCAPPPGSTLVRCNTSILERGIPSTTDTLTVDGVVRHTRQYRVIRLHGHYNNGTLTRLTPQDFPE